MSITTAVIVVAGFGTRFAPATKEQPKEMFPIMNKPIVHHIVEQLSDAGIESFILVMRPNENTTQRYFARNLVYEAHLKKKGKQELLAEFERINNFGHFANTTQDHQKGDGHALLKAIFDRSKNESFLVVFPDFLVKPEEKIFSRMLAAYDEYYAPIVAMDTAPIEELSNYGVLGFDDQTSNRVRRITQLVEKPKRVEDAPSQCFSIGYTIVTSDLIKYLRRVESTVDDGEIRIADALTKMLEDGKEVYGVQLKEKGYDCGQPEGWLEANIDFALKGPDQDRVREMLLKKCQQVNLLQEAQAAIEHGSGSDQAETVFQTGWHSD